ncbi:MAG: carboxypeptidase-like regulatory domain-containing protein [Chitinophagaceae bacterium]
MSKKLQVSINTPCHENWDSMTPIQQGKFCGSCQKQVVDFTSMSDRQIAEFFKKPSTGSVCGRFMTDQLEREIDIPRKRIPWLKYFFSIALPALFISKASAQRKMGIVARPQIKDTAKVVVVPEMRTLGEVPPAYIEPVMGKPALIDKPLTNSEFIKGKVVDEAGEPIPFASIESSKRGEGVMADENGFFTIKTNWLKKGKSLLVSSAGFEASKILAGEEIYEDGIWVIQLKANKPLPEVVLTSYQAFGCRMTTGLVSTIKGEVTSVISKTETPITKTETPLPMEEPKLLVYPNPVASGSAVNLSFKKMEEGYYQLQIISQAGQLMLQKEIWIDAEARLLNLELPTVVAGIYFVVLANTKTGKKFTEKVIIN